MSAMLRLLFVAVVVGLACALLFGQPSHGQSTDPRVTTQPRDWRGTVVHVNPAPFSACVAGWRREADRYGDWADAVAFVDFSRLSATQIAAISAAVANGDVGALNALRTVNAKGDPAAAPCLAKLAAPPLAWQVAATTSGKRPAYLLGAAGKRGAQSGTADAKLPDGSPMPCNCKVRSTEATASTYCTWLTAKQTFDAAEPVRVTLCREVK